MQEGWARWGVAALLAALLVSTGRDARSDAAARARFHDDRARAHYEKGAYDAAVLEFLQSEQIAPNPRTAFNIALCFQRLKRPIEAFSYFTEHLASDDTDERRRAYSRDAVGALASQVARIEVTSEPSGGRIFIDKKEHGEYGRTPRTLAVAPGEHRVWVELDGFRPAEASVRAARGEIAPARLEPRKIVGTLEVRSPAPGTVTVRAADGSIAATGSAPLRATVPPGAYEVALDAPGHAPWRGLAMVRADETAEATAAPAALPRTTGDLTVTSNVPGALVRLDGQPAGFSPVVLPSLSTGRHAIAVESAGRIPWSGDLSVAPNQRTWITATLEEPPQTSRSPVTWFVGGAGAVSLVGAGVVAAFAASAHSDFERAADDPTRYAMRDRGQTLNTAADTLAAVGLAALATSAILYFATASTTGRPSAATTTRSER
jgi:hypothetical protein